MESPAYSKMNSMEVVEKVDYDVVLELTPLTVSSLPAADHRSPEQRETCGFRQ